ncbi:predicted protein [Streptomyces viridosporus ATCC 14672]|uniref:Predicted protein n=1 Tax=Streptomyces viridosporus (strain ATCC 14672 / DSM 40746 / JCM 4963 / KCTC 9882 / NRRL B-12104 / FH 1290) TaxID=566461 RepID=D5ZX25_STRV1|nr:predicted protein [Streptomyces viridosporus ATCC 14672]
MIYEITQEIGLPSPFLVGIVPGPWRVTLPSLSPVSPGPSHAPSVRGRTREAGGRAAPRARIVERPP